MQRTLQVQMGDDLSIMKCCEKESEWHIAYDSGKGYVKQYLVCKNCFQKQDENGRKYWQTNILAKTRVRK